MILCWWSLELEVSLKHKFLSMGWIFATPQPHFSLSSQKTLQPKPQHFSAVLGRPRRCDKELQTERWSDFLRFHAFCPLILSLRTAREEESPGRSTALKHSHTFRKTGPAALDSRCWPKKA